MNMGYRKNYKTYYNLAFSKGTPTAFVLETPFQLLCAIEAIKEFQIEHYLVVVPYFENSFRWSQLESMLKELNLRHKAIQITENSHNDLFKQTGIFAENITEKFPRIMTGGYYSLIGRALCTLYSAKDSVCVYLDDGTATIAMLNGLETFLEYDKPRSWSDRKKWYRESYKPYMDVVSRISHCWKEVGLNDYNFLFTIYSQRKNNNFVIHSNTFAHFRNTLQHSSINNTIWVLGTVSSAISGTLQISEQVFEGVLWSKLANLRKKYPKHEILFIPHVDDRNVNVQHFCEILGIRYERLPYCVEYYAYYKQQVPEILCGFGSTALSTFRIIFPKMNIVDWVISRKGINMRVSSMVSATFNQMGIEIQCTQIEGIPLMTRLKRWIKSVLRLILK